MSIVRARGMILHWQAISRTDMDRIDRQAADSFVAEEINDK